MLKKMVVALLGTAMVAVMLASVPGAGAAPVHKGATPYEPVLDPANFVSVIDNPYYPLPVGRVLVYKDEARATDTVTVTNQTKVIEGITTTVVTQKLVARQGKTLEVTTDWFAQDKQGNVWYMGEATTAYGPGGHADTSGSWLAGVNDGEPGIIMEGNPQIPNAYRQEFLVGQAEDTAWITGRGGSLKIPYETVHAVLTTLEHSVLEPDVVELKSYAPGLGEVFSHDIAGATGLAQLVKVTG